MVMFSIFALFFMGSVCRALVIVDLTGQDGPTTLAALTCVGLFNRDSNNDTIAGPAYSLMDPSDTQWLALVGRAQPASTPLDAFMKICLTKTAVSKGYIRYSFTSQQQIIPNIVTLAAILDAVPLQDNSPYLRLGMPLRFDALEIFGTNVTPSDATSYVFDGYGNLTTTMSMMNPGYMPDGTIPGDMNPPLTGQPNLGLTDFIVKRRLFNFYMNNACVDGTADNALMERMVQTAKWWPRPTPVYGYNSEWPIFGGDIYEAETNCVKEHTLGQIASDGVNNLAYWSRTPAIRTPLRQNREPALLFNQSKVYVSLVVGDGDNVGYLKTTRTHWMMDRVTRCQNDPSNKGCFPLLWSMQPHTLRLAPDWLMWYVNQTYLTKNDYLCMPPSGYLYSYPSLMASDVQQSFVQLVEEDAKMMNLSSVVTWETVGAWSNAFSNYYPRYTANGVARAFFTVNVPFMVPILEFGFSFNKVLQGPKPVVMFRPSEWRGTSNNSIPPFSQANYLTPQQMADQFNGYPGGTATHIYLTSDGGASLDTLYQFVALLGEHVQVVGANQLVDMALAANNITKGEN